MGYYNQKFNARGLDEFVSGGSIGVGIFMGILGILCILEIKNAEIEKYKKLSETNAVNSSIFVSTFESKN